MKTITHDTNILNANLEDGRKIRLPFLPASKNTEKVQVNSCSVKGVIQSPETGAEAEAVYGNKLGYVCAEADKLAFNQAVRPHLLAALTERLDGVLPADANLKFDDANGVYEDAEVNQIITDAAREASQEIQRMVDAGFDWRNRPKRERKAGAPAIKAQAASVLNDANLSDAERIEAMRKLLGL